MTNSGSKCSVRWCAKVSDDTWKPTPQQYEFLLAQQPAEERERITQFHKLEDSKRSLMGRVLLQNAAAMALNMEPAHVQFGRTKGKKPYIKESAAAQCGLNANVSHHGPWVVLGMEDKGLVGVDVAANRPHHASVKAADYFATMEKSLTKNEWAAVRSAGSTDEEQFHAFFVLWSLKEAYTKAIGIGLALLFRRLELSVPEHILQSFNNTASHPQRFAGDSAIKIRLDGRMKPDWEFEMYALDEEHLMAVAVGPQDFAVSSYKAAMDDLLAQVEPAKKAAVRELSIASIRDSVIDTGNDKPADFSIHACPNGQRITISGTQSSICLVTPEAVLPPSLAATYQQA